MQINLQLFGGGSSGAGGNGGDLQGKGSSLGGAPSDVQDMLSRRAEFPQEVDEVMNVSQRLNKLYGDDGVITQFQTGTFDGAMAFYDSDGNICVSNKYMSSKGTDAAMDRAADNYFHPSRGNKSGLEAVASHEFGHALTDRIAKKMGTRGKDPLEKTARKIVEKARLKTGYKTNMGLAEKISGYATYNFAECVAEAFSDWYCNGSKATKQSRAIVSVMNGYLKGGK